MSAEVTQEVKEEPKAEGGKEAGPPPAVKPLSIEKVIKNIGVIKLLNADLVVVLYDRGRMVGFKVVPEGEDETDTDIEEHLRVEELDNIGKIKKPFKAAVVEYLPHKKDFDTLIATIKYKLLPRLRKAVEEEAEEEEAGLNYEVDAGGTQLKVLASDGVEMPLAGGFVDLGKRKVIAETTYAHAIKTVETKEGPKEFEVIEPITYLAIYNTDRFDGLRLEERRAVAPAEVKSVVVGERPIKFVTQSIAASQLPTLPDALKEMKAFLDGAVGLQFSEIKPEILNVLRKYINFEWDPRLYSLVASYIVFTYFFDVVGLAPRLNFIGPYGSGKSRAMKTVVHLSRHGWVILKPSQAAAFRGVEAYQPTIGIDEEALTEDLKVIYASGYKAGIKVPRVEKSGEGRFILRMFNTFSPVVTAFPDAYAEMAAQRSIIIQMKKASDPSGRDPEPHEFEDLRGKLYLARLTRLPEVLQAIDEVSRMVKAGITMKESRETEEGQQQGEEEKVLRLDARDREIWLPILTAAYLLGEDVFQDVTQLAYEDVQARKASLWSEEKTVLNALERLFGEGEELVVTSSEVQDELRVLKRGEEGDGFNEREFARVWNLGRIGRIMRRLGFVRKSTRKHPSWKAYIITKKGFCDVARRYEYEAEICKEKEKDNSKPPEECGHFSSGCGHLTSQSSPDNQGDVDTVDSVDSFSREGGEKTHIEDQGEDGGKQAGIKERKGREKIDQPLRKVSTVSTLSTLTSPPKPDLRPKVEERVFDSVVDAVWESLTLLSPKTVEEVYLDLKKWRKEGRLTVALTWDKVTKALEELEDKGAVYRYYDEGFMEERFIIRKLPPWWGGDGG